ncbi:MAG: hypothetical protein EA414_15830 [Arthrospira sp. PLM2.Bin9]|nr:pilus motility taxis protein HmpF [Arthrospira sp. PLM2.Bin9]TVU52762.1 MAG: hypothetical protein EA414_15830 [Arthrospira sp. PLM2.Bin9]
MLYLAEVQKQKSGFGLGGGRAELKLLACQRGENNWSAVPGDDLVPADDANSYKDGALVLVELNASKQVQRIEDGKKLVRILEDFSRLQDKFKNQQEEIEQWKESLTYQSQELNRREMEMESRREQMEHLEAELEKLEKQRQGLEQSKQEEERLRAEIDKARHEVESSRSQLEEEKRTLETQRAELETHKGLSPEKAQEMQGLLDRLSGGNSIDSLRELIERTQNQINDGISIGQTYRQQMEEHRTRGAELQQEVDQSAKTIGDRWSEWHQSHITLLNDRAQLNARQNLLEFNEQQIQRLEQNIEYRQTLLDQLQRLSESVASRSSSGVKVDTAALQKMPIEQLQAEVERLQQEWDRWFRMVKEQEEELKYKQEEIEELQQQINQASGGDRTQKESDLADEQDAYQMLNKTLEGQRRTLGEREDHMNQYQTVLLQRQGSAGTLDLGVSVGFPSILAAIKQQQQAQRAELEQLRDRTEQLKTEISNTDAQLSQQETEQEQKRQELEAQEQSWIAQKQTLAEIQGRANLYEELLPSLEESWNNLQQQLELLLTQFNQIQELSQQQNQTQEELSQLISGLIS